MSSQQPPSYSRAKRTPIQHLPPEEQKETKRQLNAESARRMRERKRNEDEYLRQSYAENERRVSKLEAKFQALSAELQGQTNNRR